MPQRPRTTHFGPVNLSQIDRPPLSPTDERALVRVGYDKGAWEEIGWFIRLARADLDKASPGDLLSVKEEFVAMQKVHLRVHTDLPEDEVVGNVQRIVRKNLEELADQGFTFLPEIPVRQRIEYPHIMEKLTLRGSYEPDPQGNSLPDSLSFLHAPPGIGLVAVMGQLLATVGKLIVRCPHCRNIFLQSRRNQDYCGRSCQSVAIMQWRRAEAKAQTTKKATAKKSVSRTSGKGEARHGKKRR